jgi:hypothetical protein
MLIPPLATIFTKIGFVLILTNYFPAPVSFSPFGHGRLPTGIQNQSLQVKWLGDLSSCLADPISIAGRSITPKSHKSDGIMTVWTNSGAQNDRKSDEMNLPGSIRLRIMSFIFSIFSKLR